MKKNEVKKYWDNEISMMTNEELMAFREDMIEETEPEPFSDEWERFMEIFAAIGDAMIDRNLMDDNRTGGYVFNTPAEKEEAERWLIWDSNREEYCYD